MRTKTERLIFRIRNRVRLHLYKIGIRPQAGSIWYSPSLNIKYSFEKAMLLYAKQNAEKAMISQQNEGTMCTCGHSVYNHVKQTFCVVKDCACLSYNPKTTS